MRQLINKYTICIIVVLLVLSTVFIGSCSGEKTLISEGILTDMRFDGDYGSYSHFICYIDDKPLESRFVYLSSDYLVVDVIYRDDGLLLYGKQGTDNVKLGEYYYIYDTRLPMGEKAYIITKEKLTDGMLKN
jgi:hypothetical protein